MIQRGRHDGDYWPHVELHHHSSFILSLGDEGLCFWCVVRRAGDQGQSAVLRRKGAHVDRFERVVARGAAHRVALLAHLSKASGHVHLTAASHGEGTPLLRHPSFDERALKRVGTDRWAEAFAAFVAEWRLQRRAVHHSCDGLAAPAESDVYGELTVAFDELFGAVERVHAPAAAVGGGRIVAQQTWRW